MNEPAGQRQRRGKAWLWTILAAMAFAACGRSPVAPADVGRPVADAFLAQIVAGQVDAAWESTSAEFKSDEGREAFRRYVAQHPALSAPVEFVSYERIDLHDGQLKRAQCIYSSSVAKSPTQVRVLIGLDGSEWKVDGVVVE